MSEDDAAPRAASPAGPVDPEESPSLAPSDLAFSIVGIGASAGGLQALQRFFENMPARPGMAFVVILHLSPKHESNAAEILQRSTPMPVHQIAGTTRIEIDHVYVIPPRRNLSMDDGHLYLVASAASIGRHVAIDVFFRTLAQVHRERALAIVLSGTGSDGALGLMRIKERGGLTFVQDPNDAEYDGMPSAAIATGHVDFVLPVADLPQRLVELVDNAQRIRLPPPKLGNAPSPALDESDAAETALKEIKALVWKRTGHDFTHYKRATVLRRIERRLQVNELSTLPDYRDFVRDHPDEVGALLKDLLVSVTNFFRDRDAFEALERDALPRLFAGRDPTEPIRVWVAGCATGEEAYSIAMALRDLADAGADMPDFQIFATDIDERALAIARAGLYPVAIASDVAAPRLRKYLKREGDQYRIDKSLRERVLFARHNVLRDPPFSRIDLVTCRNLLIYLDRDAQKQVLDTFRFALGVSGLLFLGTSESPDPSVPSFRVVDKKHRIYRADALGPPVRPIPQVVDSTTVDPKAQTVLSLADRRRARFEALHQQAMEQFAPPSVLVDASHQILHLSPGAGRFLEHAGGVPSHNLVTIVHPELRLELRTALFKAAQGGSNVEAHAVHMHREGRDVFVNITVRPFKGRDHDDALTLVVFDEVEDTLRAPAGGAQERADGLVVQLEDELKRQKEHLQESLEQSEASTEELKASNEELQAINEELRSTTEELETGKEELQALNEELITVNYELKVKIDETGKINDDLQNLIASTEIATIFIDHALCIKRYTPRTLEIFNLIPGDVGRSLLDIRHSLRYDALADDAADAFHSLRLIEREVDSEAVDGTPTRRFLARILPYRTTADLIDGATITFVDVTSLREAEARVREGEARLQLAAVTTREFAIFTMSDDGTVTTWNNGAERMFGYAPDEIIGQSSSILFTPEDRATGVPARELSTALATGRSEDDRWHLRRDHTRFFCSGVVTPFESGPLKGLAKIARDITGMRREQTTRDAMLMEERAARAQYEAAIRLKDEFLAVMSHELKHPLNLIHVNAELLSRMPQLRELPAALRAAHVIRKTVVGQGLIIDDLLDLSRVRTGKLTLHVVPVDLAATIETIVTAVRADAHAKDIVLAFHADHPGPVACDPVRVEQIAWNLLSNALKYTPAGGRIDVTIEVDGADARLTVSDTGPGIASAFLPHVFDMFGQEPSVSTRQDGGMGIGLALVRELALAQGGRVEAKSGVGGGASFAVWLPLHDAHPGGESDGDDIASLSLAGLRILVVEDSQEALEPFIELLLLDGALPTAAANGREALAALERGDFDLIVSDIAMPDIGGYEFIGAVRRNERAVHIPAIALTGYGRGKDKQHALDAGFDAHVTKPASIQDLRRALDRVRRATLAPNAPRRAD